MVEILVKAGEDVEREFAIFISRYPKFGLTDSYVKFELTVSYDDEMKNCPAIDT